MKITAIEITHHRLPLDPPFRPSWDFRPREKFEATIVRVKTDEGLEGIGSGDTMTGFAGHEHLFVGRDPRDIERHYRILDNIQFHYGRCWPLDLALWDLCGKIAGQPVWRLLGGRSDRVPAYASSATLRDAGAMAEAAENYLARGFRGLKLRFHRGDWRDDIRALEAVRKRIGEKLELMVDCNQGWRMSHDDEQPWTLKDALPVARELERSRVYWMEEPLHRGDRKGMRALREMVDIRIAGGEMNRELYEFRDLIEERCLDVLQPDVCLTGGITGLAPRRDDGGGGGADLHAAHLVERALLCRERPLHLRRHQRAVPGVSLRPAGMVAGAPRLHDDGDERHHEGRDGGAVGEAGVRRGAG